MSALSEGERQKAWDGAIAPGNRRGGRPDRASLTAAVKLVKPTLWSNLGGSAGGHLIWGDCQGSGGLRLQACRRSGH